MAARDFEAQIGRQHAPGRQHSGNPRYDDSLEVELAGYFCRVQSRGTTESEQREMPRIDPAADRDEPNSLGHRGIDDAMDTARRTEAVDAENGADVVDSRLGG